jgi:polar amino acid transport system permease protein
MRKIILPQAFRVIIPPTGNEFIAMMKDTALVSFLGVTAASAEIFRRAQLVGNEAYKNLEAYVVCAGLYWALTAIFTFFQRRLEAKVSQGYDRSRVIASRHKPITVDEEEVQALTQKSASREGRPRGGGV